jgi:hypothetical protein
MSVVAALAVLCVSGRASAATIPLPDTGLNVPMCGDHNESIAAPPIFRAYEAGKLIASPCQSPFELQVGGSLPSGHERVVIHERPERALGSASLGVAEGHSTRLRISDAAKQSPRPGHVDTLFRPPRG